MMVGKILTKPILIKTVNSSLEQQSWQDLISWSKTHYADLPWRTHRSLYHTLISELMLQQTTVTVVSARFSEFIAKFPDWSSLHQSSLEEICASWKGLGYYQRARNLHKLTQQYQAVEHFQDDLLAGVKQPGVGPYTQGALLSIGLNLQATALDANIRRVLSRLFGPDFHQPYQQLLAVYSPRELNEALMDLGRTLCQARKAHCSQCFFTKSCLSAHSSSLIPEQQRQKRPVLELVRLYVPHQDHILGREKNPGEWLSGYLELPTFILQGESNQYPRLNPASSQRLPSAPCWTSVSQITKYRVINHAYTLSLEEARELLGQEESCYDFYESSHPMWATSSHKIVNYFLSRA